MTAPEATFGRIPQVIVEIDQEICSRVYGTWPCTAGRATAKFSNSTDSQAEWGAGTLTDVTATAGGALELAADGTSMKPTFSITESANSLVYQDMSSVTDYVIQTGDYVEYQVLWPAGTLPYVAFDYTCTDGTNLRDASAVDQNSVSSHPNADLSTYANGTWYARKIAIPSGHVGKTISYWDVVCEADVTGTHYGFIRSLNITNGSGTVRKAVWNSGDAAPTMDAHLSSSGSFVSNSAVNVKKITGSRVSPIITVTTVDVVSGSSISWVETLNGMTDTVQADVSFDGGSTWSGYETVTNGGSIAALVAGSNVSNARIRFKNILTTGIADVTPSVDSLAISLTGFGALSTTSERCFNTRVSCQSVANYAVSATPLTLRFCQSSADIPVDLNVIPNIKGVTTSPTRLNPGGRSGRDKPLGRRAECTVRFVDHPHSDNLVDPYVSGRSYKPLERGTFWAKWVKRNQYHNNWPMRIYEGYAGQTLAQMQVRSYLIDKIDGPDSNGSVSIRGVDILRLADNDKAHCPALSTGKLSAAITSSATTLTIAGTLAQYTEYSTNAVRIEKEIIRYTGSSEADGIVTLTGLVRGSDGTTAAAHDVDDTVQACKEWVEKAPWLVAKELLINFGGVPTDYIPYTDWTTECETWLAGMTVTRLISEPIGVTTLLGEISEQCMFYIWWDEYSKLIKLRAVRPSVEVIPKLTEADNLLQNSIKVVPHPEYRASEVWVSYLQRNAAEKSDKRDNYRRTNARIDQSNFYGERRVYEVFSPWLTSSATVDILTFRLLSRYRNPPKFVNFALDAKDRALRVGDVFDLEYRGFADFTGNTEAVRYQVVSAHESPPGERVLIEAQKFDFDIGTRYSFWMVDTAPLYSAASDAEKENGMWWTNPDGTMPDGSPGYVWS